MVPPSADSTFRHVRHREYALAPTRLLRRFPAAFVAEIRRICDPLSTFLSFLRELRQGFVLLRAQGLQTTEERVRKCVKCNSHGLIRLAYSEAVYDLFQKGIDHIDVTG
jgi:hypothetical protein